MHDEPHNTEQRALRWGILSTAKIAREELAPAIDQAAGAQLLAIGSRTREAADAFAMQCHIPRAYDTYQGVLDDPDVDAVWIALPNGLHEQWTTSALASGKHVLCEKPMGLSADQVRRMSAAARRSGRFLMEGFMWRFHPRIGRALSLIADHAIGQVRHIRVMYALRNPILDDPALAARSIRLKPELGGGALADLGSYCADALRLFAGAPAVTVRSRASTEGGHPVETSVTAEVDFANGVTGQMYASMETPTGARLEIFGTAGSIRIAPAFRLREESGDVTLSVQTGSGRTLETLPFENQYVLEAEHFARVVTEGEAPLIPLAHSLETARITDAIRASWSDGETAVAR